MANVEHNSENEPHKHCTADFLSFEHVEWPWGRHENKDDRIILSRLWKDYPLATALAEMRVNILKWKWHSHSAEKNAAGALCWNQRRRLDWGLRQQDMAHTLPRKTTGCFRDCRINYRSWKPTECLWEIQLWHMTVSHKIQKDETLCTLNPTTGVHILTW